MATVGKARFVGKTSDDRRQIEEKAKKKSLWGQIGRTAGGLLATVLTGGAASPLVAAAAAGTGSPTPRAAPGRAARTSSSCRSSA